VRVLFLTTHLEIGGIATYTVSLAKALARRGHQPLVVSSGGALVQALAAAGIPHVNVDLRVKSELHPVVAAALVRVSRVVRRYRPDVIHAQTRVAHVVAGLVGRWARVPVVTTAHGFYRWRWGRRLFPFWGRRVIAIAPMTRRKLVKVCRVSPGRVVQILNGIEQPSVDPRRLEADVAWFRQAWGVAQGGPVIGSIARLGPAKGMPVLLQAFHRFRRQVPTAQLVIVGDGPEKPDLIRLAYALGEQDHIVLTGFVEQTAVPLSVMDLYVQPSFREGFGLALVEAMAMRRPVVASAVGGIRVIVRHGETGLLVPPRDPEALADALGRLAADPAAAHAMGEAGYRRFQDHFTIDRVAAEVEQVYAAVVPLARR